MKCPTAYLHNGHILVLLYYLQDKGEFALKIFTVAPLQHVEPGDLTYYAVNNRKLQYDVPTCFPLLPLIHGYVESGDAVEVFVLTMENHEIAAENYQTIKRETIGLCGEMGASCAVNRISIPFDETVESHLDTFKTLIGKISDGDTVLADITYGTKCLPIIILMALNYGYRVCKDCTIECFVYGSLDFRDGHPCGKRIYDITSLFLMDQIVNELAKSGNRNPMKAIESILTVNESLRDEE